MCPPPRVLLNVSVVLILFRALQQFFFRFPDRGLVVWRVCRVRQNGGPFPAGSTWRPAINSSLRCIECGYYYFIFLQIVQK